MNDYQKFIESKSQLGTNSGFAPIWMPEFLFDFQASLLDWSVRKGKASVMADCGLGKTPMQLVWCENIVRHTNKPVLIIAPLAVSSQTVREAEKFGIDCQKSSIGKPHKNITITNYENLHKFDPNDFAGCACDESSILKSFDGVRRNEITIFMRKLEYRSLWTATAAPNDYLELGTSSEALGYMGHLDMLGKFFKNDQNNSAIGGSSRGGRFGDGAKWRFKGHAELAFWKWVCSWGRALRKPSDLGFSNDKFILPPLQEVQHIVKTAQLADGYLFSLPACGLKEQREERRRSIKERCELAAKLAMTGELVLISCNLNDEGNLLAEMIPGSIQIAGCDTEEIKEERLLRFIHGSARVLISKQKIVGWGLNMQHCRHLISFPSNSYEQYYQFVRRCYRFGQTLPVRSDIVASEGELNILKTLQRKAIQSDKMFTYLVREMLNATNLSTHYNPKTKEKIPLWLKLN